jgi:hypothetical protein
MRHRITIMVDTSRLALLGGPGEQAGSIIRTLIAEELTARHLGGLSAPGQSYEIVLADGELRCPVCASGDLAAAAYGILWRKAAEITVNEEGGLLSVVWAVGDNSGINYEHDHYQCNSCGYVLGLPDGVEETWT